MKQSILSGLAAAACWGFSNVLSKSLLAHFAPLSLLAIQLMASNIFLWLSLAFHKKSSLSKAEHFRYALPGVLQPGLAFSFSVFGLNLTTANSEALIWAIETIVIIFLAAILLRERISWYILMLALLGTCGTVMATTPGDAKLLDGTLILGNILILIGVVCASFYSIYSQGQLNEVDPLRLTALHQLSGFILVLIVWPLSLLVAAQPLKANGLDFGLAILSGLTAYALPFFLYLKAIKGLGAARTSILLALPPVFTIFASFFVLNERLNCLQWIGVILALAAVIGICWTKETKHAAINL